MIAATGASSFRQIASNWSRSKNPWRVLDSLRLGT